MKFLQKHKNKIFALCLAAVLLSCFMGFSFSSSAANISQVVPINDIRIYMLRSGSYYGFSESDGVYSFVFPNNVPAGFSFNGLEFDLFESFEVVAPSGKGVSLGLTVDFKVLYDGSIAEADGRIDNILEAVIWRGCFLRVYASGLSLPLQVSPYSFILRDVDSGDILEVTDDFIYYWETFASSSRNLQLVVLFDFSSLIGSTLSHVALFIPGGSNYNIYCEPGALAYQFSDFSASYNFVYRPFDDVVQDDLSDIKGSLSGVNNKLDSISSSMNTIDQDINRVNQTVSDLRDDLTQGDPDIESSNSDLQDQITDAKDEIGVIDSEINSVVSDILDKYPDAENPFDAPDVPILSDIWASEFIEELWGFFKAQSIFFTFIHTGLLFCLVSFILRR